MTAATATAAAQALRRGEVTAQELAERALARAEEQAHLGAFLALDPAAPRRAAALDAEAAAGRWRGPLHGLPVAIKDNLCTTDLPTTAGSRLLAGYHPPYDAHAVERLVAAGAVVIGKTNLDEFGMGSSNEHSAWFPARNPLDPTRSPGGSSGGSAAAVAAGIVPLALGSDTGGSVRQPASFCGVVGVKPTWGRVSRRGLVAFASSLDTVGVIASDVGGAAWALEAIAGEDPGDATSARRPAPVWAPGSDEPLRVGLPTEYLDELEPLVSEALRGALRSCAGVDVVDITLPHARFGVPAYCVPAMAEASSNLSRYDGLRYGQRSPGEDLEAVVRRSRSEGFGAEVQRRILLGTYALSAGYQERYYLQAVRARDAVAADFDAAWARVDLVAAPTSPTTAFPLGSRRSPLEMYRSDVFTVGASLAGLPAVSVPVGRDEAGLPRGLQLIGPAWSEERLLAAADRVARGGGS